MPRLEPSVVSGRRPRDRRLPLRCRGGDWRRSVALL